MPFNNRFGRLSSFDRYDYSMTLLCIATAAALMIAPSIHHRLLFRRGQKPYIVKIGTQLLIVAMAFLAVGMTGILVLITDVMFGGVTAAIVGVLATVVVGGLWFGMPLNRRRAA